MQETYCPDPGVYRDVPFEDYLQWNAISNSRLKLATRSLAHYKAGYQGNDTPALRFGSLVHAGKLEPLEIARRYAVMPNWSQDAENVTRGGERTTSKSTTYYKDRKTEFTRANADKTIVTSREYDEMIGVLTSLASNSLATEVLDGPGDIEVSIVWEDNETGMMCKGRVDKLKASGELFADLKTTRDALRFNRYIIDHGYHRQMAFYRWGLRLLTGEELTPWLVAVESTAPFGCRAAPVCPELLQGGWLETRQSLDIVAEAMKTNHYPGYDNPDRWIAPSFYSPNIEPVALTIGGKTLEV